MQHADTIVTSRGPWLTLSTSVAPPRGGAAMNDLGEKSDWAAALVEGRIAGLGPRDEVLGTWESENVLDLGSRLVMPGFIDPHTHPVFHASRELEFEMRNQGKSYVEIAEAGGGIRSSVRSLREASEDLLVDLLARRADGFLALGTTTIEAKSGYGLSRDDELKSLRAMRRVAASHPLDMIPTFLGAHEIPDEYREDREGYIRLLIEDMIPAVAAEGLARYADVFCEAHVFTTEESRRILEAAAAHGMPARVHADEIESTGGAELAVSLRAATADHLGAISEAGIEALAGSETIPVLLPGTSFYLNLDHIAPGRRMVNRGLPVALATDFNPGSCPTRSLPMIMTLACLHYGFTAAEAITACTVNAAASLGLAGDRGRLEIGMRADIIALDAPSFRYIPYVFGENLVTHVIKNGRLVHTNDRCETTP